MTCTRTRLLLLVPCNEPDNLSFLLDRPRLADVLRVAAKYWLFATDRTLWSHFPIFHNVLVGLARGLLFARIQRMPFTTCRWSRLGLPVRGLSGGSSGVNVSHCSLLKSPGFMSVKCLRLRGAHCCRQLPIFYLFSRIQRGKKKALAPSPEHRNRLSGCYRSQRSPS